MRCSSSKAAVVSAAAGLVAFILTASGGGADDPTTPPAPPSRDLLVNGGFEQHHGPGTIPIGWQVIDEHFEYWGWIAPRVERRIGTVGPRSGRYLVGIDTEKLGIDSNGEYFHIPRAALFQTITLPGRTRGTFTIHYNDLGSSALAHLSTLRLAYTVNHTEISKIKIPETTGRDPAEPQARSSLWSRPYYRVSQKLPFSQTAIGDWSRASIPVVLDVGDAPVRLTLWIGVFDNQSSTELGYYRIDDASFVVDPRVP